MLLLTSSLAGSKGFNLYFKELVAIIFTVNESNLKNV